MRFVRTQEWDARRGSVEIERCRRCCEGNNVNPKLERGTINRYMARWRLEHGADSREDYEARQRERRAEDYESMVAWRAMQAEAAIRQPQRRHHRKVIPLPTFKPWDGGQP